MKRKTKSPPTTATEPPVLIKRTLALFKKALEDRENLRRWIGELSSRQNLTVKDRLCLALYRHQLSFREPPLSPGLVLNAVTLRLAFCGQEDTAVRLLKSAIDGNYCAYVALEKDPLLAPLRNTPVFSQLLSAAKQCQDTFLAGRTQVSH
jgi:hypothetical protein